MNRLLIVGLLLGIGAFDNSIAQQLYQEELKPLVAQLRRSGFKLVFKHPPVKSAYGMFVPKTRTLYISPLAFDLGIGKQVLIHEATHAAQSCPGGTLSPIGWKIKVSELLNNEISGILYNSYKQGSKALEQEAFMVQRNDNGVAMVIAALAKRCHARAAK